MSRTVGGTHPNPTHLNPTHTNQTHANPVRIDIPPHAGHPTSSGVPIESRAAGGTEPYVRLVSLRALHAAIAHLNLARPLPDTLQAVVEGVVAGTDYSLAACHLVRPGGDLMVAAVAGTEDVRETLLGQMGSRADWEAMLNGAERLGGLRFIPQESSGRYLGNLVPRWAVPSIPQVGSPDPGDWQPGDILMVPMYTSSGDLLGVITGDRPRNGRRPNAWVREGLEMYSLHASIAIANATLRSDMQRAMARLEQEQQALRASEESFRQAFEYAPSGMAMTELYPGERIGKLLRTNDALCRMLGRPDSTLSRFGFADLVHPEDLQALLNASPSGGRAEVRLARRDGHYMWVCLRHSVLADAGEGPHYLLTHIEDIDERKRHEATLAHRASHDALTGLPNGAELRARLEHKLCTVGPPLEPPGEPGTLELAHHGPAAAGDGSGLLGVLGVVSAEPGVWSGEGGYGGHRFGGEHRHDRAAAVIFCDLDGFKPVNDRYGHHVGDAVLVEVARRLQQMVRSGDTVARLGGDEFVVLADNVVKGEAEDLAGRLEQALVRPIQVDGHSIRVGVSFGIGWASCGMTADEVLRAADQRMYHHKRRRRSRSQRRAG